MDARSYPAAVANRAKGGGCECEGNHLITTLSSSLYHHWQERVKLIVPDVKCLHFFSRFVTYHF